jgi:hypothetical protein
MILLRAYSFLYTILRIVSSDRLYSAHSDSMSVADDEIPREPQPALSRRDNVKTIKQKGKSYDK